MDRKIFILALATVLLLAGCPARRGAPVTIYVSEDQVFSEPVLKDFERDTGIPVKAVFDTEEAKSTGVMNRIVAEKNNPQADLYWANEPIRAEVLKQQGLSASYFSPSAAGIPDKFKDPQGHWTGFSARARVFIVNKSSAEKPANVRDYAAPRFKSKTVIANPLFGTTTAYVAALFTVWGDDAARTFLGQMKSNGVKLSTSNGESADMVAAGQFAFGLADSDDAYSRLKQGRSIDVVYPDQGPDDVGCMIIPNALVLIRNGPNPEGGKKLFDYLISKDTERKLAFSDAVQIPLHPGVDIPPQLKHIENLKTMTVDYGRVAAKMQEIQPFLKSWAGL